MATTLEEANARIHQLIATLARFKSTLTCPICTDFIALPFSTACGHSFCFSCLNAWFNHNNHNSSDHQNNDNHNDEDDQNDDENDSNDDDDDQFEADDASDDRPKPHCPICRRRIVSVPTQNYVLAEQTDAYVALNLPTSTTTTTTGSLNNNNNQNETNGIKSDQPTDTYQTYLNRVATARQSLSSFDMESWKSMCSVPVIRDAEDGVRRCAMCLWEVVGKCCTQCGAEFSDDGGELSDEGESVGDDDEEEDGDDDEDEEGEEGDGGHQKSGRNEDEYLATDEEFSDIDEEEEDEDDEDDENMPVKKKRRIRAFIEDECEESDRDDRVTPVTSPKISTPKKSSREFIMVTPQQAKDGALIASSATSSDSSSDDENDDRKNILLSMQ